MFLLHINDLKQTHQFVEFYLAFVFYLCLSCSQLARESCVSLIMSAGVRGVRVCIYSSYAIIAGMFTCDYYYQSMIYRQVMHAILDGCNINFSKYCLGSHLYTTFQG